MDQLTDRLVTGLGPEDLRREAAARRTERWADREFLQVVTVNPRCRYCGTRRIDASQARALKLTPGNVAYIGNVMACGLVWGCPVCGAKIRFTRAGEVLQVLAGNLSAGGGSLFLTSTVPHSGHHRLAPLVETVTRGWNSASSFRAGRTLFADLGINGYVRALEVTHGWKNGWHPHLHIALLLSEPTTQALADELHDRFFPLWRDAITAAGLAAPTAEHGVDVRQVTHVAGIADYLSKVEGADAFSREIVYANHKKGRNGNRSYAQILRDARLTGDMDDVALINEYERAMKGRRLVQMSRGLKARWLVEEKTDQEIASEVVGGETLMLIDEGMWRALRRERGSIAELLNVTEVGGAEAAKQFVWKVMGKA